MNRSAAIARLGSERFDVLVIGGGATGLGCALDAAARGYRTGLIEARDFANATSSRSTKLIHGGVRYLRQGNIALVREALRERARLAANAPDVVQELRFVIPAYSAPELAYYRLGLKAYDVLAAGSTFPRSRALSSIDAKTQVPGMTTSGLSGAVLFSDAQFDDARLAVALAKTATARGAAVANYVRADAFLTRENRICGVRALDAEIDRSFPISAKTVINATGIFADRIRALDDANAPPLLTFSRGSHIVLPGSVLGDAKAALLVPRTGDGRVLFAIPWLGHTLAGTTDVAAGQAEFEPHASEEEVQYIIATLNPYLETPVNASGVLSAWAGLRPLVNRRTAATAKLSREHAIEISRSGLVSITGGKWTTYRKMAQDAVDAAAADAELPAVASPTADLRLEPGRLPEFGSTRELVAYTVREEMARTVEDILARRTRALFLDWQSAAKWAPEVETALSGMQRS